MLRRITGLALALLLLAPLPCAAQRLERVAIGGGLGVAGGVAVTLAVITARAHLQNEYLHHTDDLIHWQSVPMVVAPAVGVTFGLAGSEALEGSVEGSVGGWIAGAAIGAGVGRLVSGEPEAPWAGALIGGGAGMTIGGLTLGILGWRRGERRGGGPPPPPVDVTLIRIPL